MKRLILYIAGLIFLAGCSTTKHLPEGEILYTGQKPMIVLNRSETSVGEIAMEEVEAALATAPNNSLLGSSTIRYPFPFGLWIYNGFQKYEKGLGKWIFNKFAATPVLLSTVNPDIRQKAAVNLLRDYGYFNGSVSYKTFIDPKDSLKAKLQYTVNMRNPYFIDTVYYRGFNQRTTRIMELGRRRSLISPGEQFNVADLEEGALYWLDGIGNRVAAIAFGPRKVLLVAGRNKIVATRAAAEARIRDIAAPRNVARLGQKTPCAVTGVCADCDSEGRICNTHLRMERCFPRKRITVILIDEEMGL